MTIQRHKRVQTKLPLTWRATIQSTILNISRGGLFFETPVAPAVGDTLDLSFTLSTSPEALQITGVVRWISTVSDQAGQPTPYGVGLEFRNLDSATLQALERFIEARLRDRQNDRRVSVRLVVDYFFAGENYRTIANDISRKGMFLVTDEPLQLEDTVRLRFHIPQSEALIKTTAIVRWRHDAIPPELSTIVTPGMGVEFADLPSEDQELIERFIQSLQTPTVS